MEQETPRNMKTEKEIAEKAQAIWEVMDKNQRMGAKCGMFPAELMGTPIIEEQGFSKDERHKIVVALMKMK
jgi:hypothetical protein